MVALFSELRLYCHDVSRALLLSDVRYTRLEAYVVGLPVNEPVEILNRNSSQAVTLTLLGAGHCPGSVM